MADINESVSRLITRETELTSESGKVAHFSYTEQAYNSNAYEGQSDYEYNREQNIPLGTSSALDTSNSVLAKGFRAQASSISRQLINHFFGRVSYNLNKAHDWLKTLLESFQVHLRQDGNLWSPTSAYKVDDVCFVLDTLDNKRVIRFFRCIESTASGIVNTPPIVDGNVDSIHWQECNVFDELKALRFDGEATDIADGAVTTEKLADGAVTRAKLASGVLGIFRVQALIHGTETVVPFASFPDFAYDPSIVYNALALPSPAYRNYLISACLVQADGVHVYPKYVENGEVKDGTGFATYTFGNEIFGERKFSEENLVQDTVTMTIVLF